MFVVCSLVPVASRTLVQEYLRIQQVITHGNQNPFLYLFTLINNIPDFSSPPIFHKEGMRIKRGSGGERYTYKARAVFRRYYTLKLKYAIMVKKKLLFVFKGCL